MVLCFVGRSADAHKCMGTERSWLLQERPQFAHRAAPRRPFSPCGHPLHGGSQPGIMEGQTTVSRAAASVGGSTAVADERWDSSPAVRSERGFAAWPSSPPKQQPAVASAGRMPPVRLGLHPQKLGPATTLHRLSPAPGLARDEAARQPSKAQVRSSNGSCEAHHDRLCCLNNSAYHP